MIIFLSAPLPSFVPCALQLGTPGVPHELAIRSPWYCLAPRYGDLKEWYTLRSIRDDAGNQIACSYAEFFDDRLLCWG